MKFGKFKKLLISDKLLGLAAIAMVLSLSLVGFEAATAPAAKASGGCNGSILSWPTPSSSFSTLVQNSEDYIQTREVDNGNPALIQVVLTTSSFRLYPTQQNVTWWKGAEIQAYWSDVVLSGAYTQDYNHGPTSAAFTLSSSYFYPGAYCLQLSKAKFLGAHTPMYSFYLDGKAGKTIYINWLRDTPW
jgi:hypothetical protein